MTRADQPRCPQCRSISLTLQEEHRGLGIWQSDEWHNEDGEPVFDGEGVSWSEPTGRWLYECEDCGHGWTKRRRGER